MIRAYLLYIFMFLVMAVGLTMILRVGSRLEAPEDFSGEWDVHWGTTTPTGRTGIGSMKINQSGRFCSFQFDHQQEISMTLFGGEAIGKRGGSEPLAELRGEHVEMTLRRGVARDTMEVDLRGAQRWNGIAHRKASSLTTVVSEEASEKSSEHASR